MTLRAHVFLLLFTSLALTGCPDDGNVDKDTSTAADTGAADTTPDPAAYFSGSLSSLLGASGNQAKCSTCHSDDGTQEGFSGYPLNDSAFLADYKGGKEAGFLDATNFCIEEFMGGQPLTASDTSYQSIKAYADSLSDQSVTASREENPVILDDQAAYGVQYAGGDAVLGEAAFNIWCSKCHTRQLKLGVDSALTVETVAFYTVGRIAQKARTSSSAVKSGNADPVDETPGPMPFFLPNILPDEDLKNIVAYLRTQQ